MKKFILATFVAIATLACSKENISDIDKGDITTVEFNVALADVASRAFAKGDSVDCL